MSETLPSNLSTANNLRIHLQMTVRLPSVREVAPQRGAKGRLIVDVIKVFGRLSNLDAPADIN
jgi:hypothetical protein